MYLGFAEDPVAFLNTIIASQVSQECWSWPGVAWSAGHASLQCCTARLQLAMGSKH
jgi:hypothetical protein